MNLNKGSTYLQAAPIPAPSEGGLDTEFWRGAQAEELRLQFCESCRKFQMPIEWICHRCHGLELSWRAVEPEGLIHSWMRVHHAVHPGLEASLPYLVVLVELPRADHVRLIGNLLGDRHADPVIGARVRAEFEHGEHATLIQWRLAG